MYDELVKRLRDAVKMSEALSVLLPHSEGNATAKLYNEAADAIERMDYEIKSLYELLGTHPDPRGEDGEPFVECIDCQKEATNVIEELTAYVRQIEELRKDGYYLQKTKMMTYGQATMTMPLPQPPKEG